MSSSASAIADQVNDLVGGLVSLDSIDGDVLRDRLVDLQTAQNMIEAEQAAVMVEMHRRTEADDAAREAALAPGSARVMPEHAARLAEFVSDEIAVLLSCTRMLATHRLTTAIEASTLPGLMSAWRNGTVDTRKAVVISSGLHEVDPVFADTVAAEAARYAATHTATQTRAWLARRVIAADPGMAEIRRARASEGRRVTLTPLADGMAELNALLPAVQARQVYDSVNAIAQTAGASDTRTMDQRRADALLDLVTGRAEPPRVQVQVVVSADTLMGESDAPGWISGLGPITAPAARQLACGGGSATFDHVLADPETGGLIDATTLAAPRPTAEPRYRPSARLERAIRARDLTCRFPGCRRSAVATPSGTDLDHTVPWPAGATAWSNLAVLCRRHHRLKHTSTWTAELSPDGTMTWTTPTGRRHITEPWSYFDPPDTS
jgi:hypothetical protein